MSESPTSPSESSFVSPVPDGHVWLILIEAQGEEDSSFYLEIPVDVIGSLCLKPLKYLLFLGWCILGVEGVLTLEPDGDEISTNGELDNKGIYYFVSAGADYTHAVDLDVIKVRTNVSLGSTHTRNEFRANLLERDVCCIWSGIEDGHGGVGLHIIPYVRGSEWFQLIIANRPKYGEDVMELDDIDDIRNGMFANTSIHYVFDRRHIAILKTPNKILRTCDIPARSNREIPDGVSYPGRVRYTLQWLNPKKFAQSLVPNNGDATFKTRTRKPKPSDLLLHYNYGAAAIKCWGHGVELLKNRANPPHPPVPVAAPVGPAATIHDRTIAIPKCDAARAAGGAGARNTTAGARTREPVESEGQVIWDEDDAMLFFWGNSQAAKERHLKKVGENTRRMEQWREAVP